jgi:hypothetical protein
VFNELRRRRPKTAFNEISHRRTTHGFRDDKTRPASSATTLLQIHDEIGARKPGPTTNNPLEVKRVDEPVCPIEHSRV